ncbi:MAG: serine hydrolase domain-containing protein [Candidatus Poribacteria bacterium]
MGCDVLAGLLILILVSQAIDTVYYPLPEAEGGWRSLVTPNQIPNDEEKQKIVQMVGLDWDKLSEVWKYCESFGGPNSLLIIRNGWIAGEWYNFTEPRGIASCTKSLTSLAMAKLFDLSDEGKLKKRINVDDEAWQFLPSKWVSAEPKRKHIKIRNMLTMTSGLTPYDGPYKEDYEEKIYAQMVESPPGTVWAYASVPVDMLSLIIEDVTDQRLEGFFSEHIGNVIGIGNIKWGRFNNHTGGSGGPEGGARFPARELARVGYLVLNDGLWERNGKKEQVISKERIREFTQKASWLEKTTWRLSNFAEKDSNLFYSHLWWNNSTGQALGETTPRDTIFMAGWGKQACFVVPSLNMIVVRLGPNGSLNQNTKFYHELWRRIMSSIIRKE